MTIFFCLTSLSGLVLIEKKKIYIYIKSFIVNALGNLVIFFYQSFKNTLSITIYMHLKHRLFVIYVNTMS